MLLQLGSFVLITSMQAASTRLHLQHVCMFLSSFFFFYLNLLSIWVICFKGLGNIRVRVGGVLWGRKEGAGGSCSHSHSPPTCPPPPVLPDYTLGRSCGPDRLLLPLHRRAEGSLASLCCCCCSESHIFKLNLCGGTGGTLLAVSC